MFILKNISKSYNKNLVLDNISITIDKGITVILGPSGSGKTTLLNILGGIDSQSKGVLFYNNELVKPFNLKRYKVSFIFQNYNLFNELNVLDNIKMGTFKKFNYKNVLNALNLDKLKNKYPYQLSGGEKQRVAIARAISRDSDYILADEPTGALDLDNSLNVLKILINLNKNIIIVTHNELIKYLADKVIYMNSGRIIKVEKGLKKNIEDIKWV